MRLRAVFVLAIVAACGGNSRRLSDDGRGTGATGGASATGGGVTGGSAGSSASGGTVGGSGGSGGSIGVGASAGSGGSAGKGLPAFGGGSGGTNAQAGAPDEVGGTAGSGSGRGGSAGGGEAGMAGSAGMAITPITSCSDEFPFSGTWLGSVLDFYFEPQQSLRLVIASDGMSGTLTWGEGDPPPRPEGADVPYPPGYWDQQIDMDPEFGAARPTPWPGFVYTIVRGAGCDSTLRFAVSTPELWQDWCALQQPVFTPDQGWGCTLRGGGSSDRVSCTVQPEGVSPQTYPLWKCAACGAFYTDGGVCACDEHECFANLRPTHTFDLTLIQAGGKDVLTGADPTCGDCTVRLERQD